MLDHGCLSCEEKMKKLFLGNEDVQVKIDLIPYFTESGSCIIDEFLEAFSKSNDQDDLFPQNDGVFYNSKKIHPVFNQIPWSVKKAVEKHLKDKK